MLVIHFRMLEYASKCMNVMHEKIHEYNSIKVYTFI